jgi:hypothetical protein
MTIGYEALAPSRGGARSLNLVFLCVGGFALLALASYGLAAYGLLRGLLEPGLAYTLVDRDFANYWVAGRLALSGEHLDLFTHDLYFPRLQQLFGEDYQIRSWSYPPHYLLFLWPLGLVDYKTGFIGFLGGTLLLFAFAVFVFKRELAPRADTRVLLLALLGYVLMMLVAAQNGFLLAAFLLLGLAWMKRRPVLAAAAFACLTVKPQLALLIPVLLLFDRNWVTLFRCAAFTAVLLLLSVLFFGLDSWSAYFSDTLEYQRSVMSDWHGTFLRMMPTVFGSMRTLGFSPGAALQAQLPVSLGAAGLVFWLLYVERDRLRRAFVVTCGTFLITPYAFDYDMGALSVCAALLAADQAGAMRRLFTVPIASVGAISAAVTTLGLAGVPCAPLVLAMGLAVLVLAARPVSERPPETPPSEPTRS